MQKRVLLLIAVTLSLFLIAARNVKPLTAGCYGAECRGFYYYEKGCWESWIAGQNYGIGHYGEIHVEIPYSYSCKSNWTKVTILRVFNCPNFGVVKAQEEPYPYYSTVRFINYSGIAGCVFQPGQRYISRMVSGLVPVYGWGGLTRYGNWNYSPLVRAYAP